MNKLNNVILDGSNEEASERLEEMIKEIDKDKSQISSEGDCCSLIDNRLHLTFLDGSPEEEDRIVNEFLDSLTEEEKERAMSSEFDYLDED
ncbi:MAG: hypothetical protein UD936_02550 [Acutalibacteraceae bacterium]|nr:hypothetical protein [Acutalibacteraceae bacterium]